MRRFLLACALFCLAGFPARAASDCILDRCADKAPSSPAAAAPTVPAPRGAATPAIPTPRGGSPAAGFDFYLLALSWSPGFCENEGGARAQCEPGQGKTFVVHGLWPQNDHGYPGDCPGASSPSRIALERARGLFPDEGLARHEWRKHGTCSGKSPSDYFDDVRRARDLVAIPEPFVAPKQAQKFVPIDIERAFIAANPRLRPGMMAVGCRRGVLEDVKICLSRDLREFVACPEVAQRSCRGREVDVPAPM